MKAKIGQFGRPRDRRDAILPVLVKTTSASASKLLAENTDQHEQGIVRINNHSRIEWQTKDKEEPSRSAGQVMAGKDRKKAVLLNTRLIVVIKMASSQLINTAS